MSEAYASGIATLPTGTYDRPERDLATDVLRDAVADAGVDLRDVDGVYMPKPRPWTDQKFFSTFLLGRLGLDVARNVEIYTGGTSGGKALHAAVGDVRSGTVETAVVLAVERNSVVDTAAYFEYVLGLFDREFQSPAGPTIPGVYAQGLQRYLHEHGVDREDVASVVVKNRDNAAANPEAMFGTTTVEEVLTSAPIADPLCLYECPALCDGAAAVVVTAGPTGDGESARIAGVGHHHPPSHLTGVRGASLASLPAVEPAADEALADAGVGTGDLDLLEPYAPFPHVEAILTEELGLFERGDGAAACARGETRLDGTVPVSPSGGCLGRGHPAMVTPLLNHAEAVRQIRGTAASQVEGAETVLTTSEHGHVDGMTATVFAAGGAQ